MNIKFAACCLYILFFFTVHHSQLLSSHLMPLVHFIMRKEEIERVCTIVPRCDRQLQLDTAVTVVAETASPPTTTVTAAMRMRSWAFAFFVHIGRILIERKENFVFFFSSLRCFSLMVVVVHASRVLVIHTYTYKYISTAFSCYICKVYLHALSIQCSSWITSEWYVLLFVIITCKFNGTHSLFEIDLEQMKRLIDKLNNVMAMINWTDQWRS